MKEQQPLRVLYLSWRDRDNPEAGGAEVFTERTSEVMTQLGSEVTLFSSRFPGSSTEDRHGDVRVVRRGGRFGCYVAGLHHLLTHRDDYDVVIDVQNGVPFWAPLVAKVPVVNITHHVHRDQWPVIFGPRVARFGWFLESKVAPRVYRGKRYVTVSNATRDDLGDLGVRVEDVDLVYSGNDLPENYESYADVPRSPQPSMVVVCRLVPHKQVELAIDALAELRETLPDLTLDIVGAGYWRADLEDYAERSGVSNAVTFHGFVDEETKHHLLARAWISLMPSHKEGWGLTIVEAGLHSTPTIAFAHAGGPSESIVHGVTGLLAHDSHDMIAQARALLTHDRLRTDLGAAARTHAQSFSWDAAGQALHATVLSVLGRGPRPLSLAAVHGRHRSIKEIVADHENAHRAPLPQRVDEQVGVG
ncbi:glycosyltransferase family 4 protein [Calidifontibacter terrae]